MVLPITAGVRSWVCPREFSRCSLIDRRLFHQLFKRRRMVFRISVHLSPAMSADYRKRTGLIFKKGSGIIESFYIIDPKTVVALSPVVHPQVAQARLSGLPPSPDTDRSHEPRARLPACILVEGLMHPSVDDSSPWTFRDLSRMNTCTSMTLEYSIFTPHPT